MIYLVQVHKKAQITPSSSYLFPPHAYNYMFSAAGVNTDRKQTGDDDSPAEELDHVSHLSRRAKLTSK